MNAPPASLPPPAPPVVAPSLPGERETIVMLAMLMALYAMAIDPMLPALPAMARDLDIAVDNHRQYIIAVYLIGTAVGSLFYGPLADRFGRKPMLLIYGIGGALAAIPVFLTLETVTSPWIALLVLLIPLSLLSGYSANNALVKAELFPAHIRGLGVALPYAIGNAAFAGTAELVALALKDAGVERLFYVYVALVIGLAGVATLLLPETRDESLIEQD